LYDGAVYYLGFLVITLISPFHLIAALAPVAALALTAAFLGAFAASYWVAVKNIVGTRKGAWSLPDAATLAVEVDPADALSRVLTLAYGAFPSIRWTADETALTLTRKRWWGSASVRVVATAIDGGTRLVLRVGKGRLVNNLIGRAIVARLSREIANKQAWRHP
jgi:hypothetical protein